MTFEPPRVGDFLTVFGFIIVGLGIIWAMKGELKMLSRDVQAQGVKIDKLEEILTVQAVQNERLNMLDRRLNELAHWKGFIGQSPIEDKRKA